MTVPRRTPMFRHFEELRRRPLSVRRRAAFFLTLVATLVIVALWFAGETFVPRSEPVPERVNEVAGPLEGLRALFRETADLFSDAFR